MTKTLALITALTLVAAIPAGPAAAQNSNAVGGAIIGGTAGAIIGGAIAGGIIGAAAGAALGASLEARPNGYYWYDGRCYRRDSNGDYHPVGRARCY